MGPIQESRRTLLIVPLLVDGAISGGLLNDICAPRLG